MELVGCAATIATERLISIPPANNVGISKTTIRLNGYGKMREPTGCWSKFKNTLAEEFKLQNIRLGHYPVEDFYKSQWQSGDRSFWFLLYRWCVAAFYITSVILCAIKFFDNARFFIYLTDWGLMLCMIATTYGAVLTTLWHFDRVDGIEQSWSVKIFWMIHWAALVLSVVITLMFWSILLPTVDPSVAGDPFNILQHATNSVVMMIDHFVVAFPSRILHFVYPLAIGIAYLLFSLIYYFSGGTGAFDTSYIYPILDWEESPLMACASVVIAVVSCFVFSFVLFWLYKLRVYLWKTFANSQKAHTIHY